MADHNDHGPVATHPLMLGVAGFAFVVLLVLGFQLWASAGHDGDAGHASQSSTH